MSPEGDPSLNFMTRFDELGYKVNKQTGYVVKVEESKSDLVNMSS